MAAYSGKFVLRLPGELHERLAGQASQDGLSLNALCLQILRSGFSKKSQEAPWRREALAMLPLLKKQFGAHLVAVAAFGSQVSGEATADSDLDLLIVLKPLDPITRSLYAWWDRNVAKKRFTINPHFVHLTSNVENPGSLWFEIALNHEILFEKNQALQAKLTGIQGLISSGKVSRKWSYGHPYWIRGST